MAAEVQGGVRLLDVGCGTGLAALLASQRGADVTALDAAEASVAIARSRLGEQAVQRADLERLPFADDTFDVVTGFNAFQYATEPAAALRDARRVLRARGRVVVATWGRPEDSDAAAIVGVLKPFLPAPPPGAPGPFALSDEAALKKLVTDAGLVPLEISDVDCPFIYPSLEQGVLGLGSSGVAVKAIENSGQQAVDAAHRQLLLDRGQRPDGSYRLECKFRFLLARK